MVVGVKQTLDESSLVYQSRTVLADLANEFAAVRNLNTVNDKVLRATKIRLWLKALDYKKYLSVTQREKIKYALVEVSGVYDLPTAPVLNAVTQPAVLVNTSVKIRRKTA
jgi:hypothetical protein